MKIRRGILTFAVGATLALASSAPALIHASAASRKLTKSHKTARLHHSARTQAPSVTMPATGTDRPYPTVTSYPGIYGTIPSYASGLPGSGG
jgi:hypothetical protein